MGDVVHRPTRRAWPDSPPVVALRLGIESKPSSILTSCVTAKPEIEQVVEGPLVIVVREMASENFEVIYETFCQDSRLT